MFVWVKLTMSCAHKWSTGDNMSCHCLSNRSNIKRQSSQAARHNAHCTLSSLKYSPSHFLSQVHTLSDKQFPRLKTFRPPKKRQLLSSLWLVAQSTLCSYPAPPSLVNASHCVVSDAAIRMGSIVPLSLNIRSPFHESCFRIHQWSSQHSEYGIIGNYASSEVQTGHRWSAR